MIRLLERSLVPHRRGVSKRIGGDSQLGTEESWRSKCIKGLVIDSQLNRPPLRSLKCIKEVELIPSTMAVEAVSQEVYQRGLVIDSQQQHVNAQGIASVSKGIGD